MPVYAGSAIEASTTMTVMTTRSSMSVKAREEHEIFLHAPAEYDVKLRIHSFCHVEQNNYPPRRATSLIAQQ